MMDIKVGLLRSFTIFFVKSLRLTKKQDVVVHDNQQFTKELLKPIIKKSKEAKVHPSFKDNIWSADLVNTQLKSKYSKGI